MLRLRKRFDARHVHRVELVEMRARSRLGHETVELVTDDFLGEPHDFDQFVEIDPGVYAHLLQHVHQVFSGYHHRGLSHPAIRAAGHAADGRLQAHGVVAVEHAQRRIDGCERGAPCIMEMQVEIGDGREAFLDFHERALDLVRHIPARRIRKPDARDRQAGVVPRFDHAVEHFHQLFRRHFARPVGAKAVADVEAAVLGALRLGLLDHLRPRLDLLGLRAVRIALREHVAHVHPRRVFVRFGRQWRRVFRSAVLAFVVQRSVGVAHARFRRKRADEIVHTRHLRRPLRADKRADRDFLEACFRQRIEKADFSLERNVRAFDLQPVAHAFFGVDDFRIAAHYFTSV